VPQGPRSLNRSNLAWMVFDDVFTAATPILAFLEPKWRAGSRCQFRPSGLKEATTGSPAARGEGKRAPRCNSHRTPSGDCRAGVARTAGSSGPALPGQEPPVRSGWPPPPRSRASTGAVKGDRARGAGGSAGGPLTVTITSTRKSPSTSFMILGAFVRRPVRSEKSCNVPGSSMLAEVPSTSSLQSESGSSATPRPPS